MSQSIISQCEILYGLGSSNCNLPQRVWFSATGPTRTRTASAARTECTFFGPHAQLKCCDQIGSGSGGSSSAMRRRSVPTSSCSSTNSTACRGSCGAVTTASDGDSGSSTASASVPGLKMRNSGGVEVRSKAVEVTFWEVTLTSVETNLYDVSKKPVEKLQLDCLIQNFSISLIL